MDKLSIDKLRTALVVIDLQKGVVERKTVPYSTKVVVNNASRLAETFRISNMPVFLVRVNFSPDGRNRLNLITDAAMPVQTPPQEWSEIVPELGPKKNDIVITKHQWGAFYGTDLELELRRRGITTIVLCGIHANAGVESTARFAYEYGYNQIFAEDAISAMSEEEYTFPITKIFPRMGLVRKTEAILAAL